MALDRDLPMPIYRQLAALLRAEIQAGRLAGRLPSARTLQQEHTVSQRTAERALRTLAAEGWAQPVIGLGYFARQPSTDG